MATTSIAPALGRERPQAIARPIHTALVLLVQLALSLLSWYRLLHAPPASFNRLSTYFRTMLAETIVVAVIVFGVVSYGSSLETIFGERWRTPFDILRDLAIGVAFWMASTILLSALMGHGHSSSGVQLILPRSGYEKFVWVLLSAAAGIAEEAIFRGYLQKQFAAFTRSVPAGIAMSAGLFGTAHLYQGWRGAVVIAAQGVLLGILAAWRRSVRPGMIAHAWQDAFAGLLARAANVPVR
jgi:uncharacterized protein